eukprot:COSAG02_NODE_12368_length_1557_cov_1.279835_2_plen_320_part_00
MMSCRVAAALTKADALLRVRLEQTLPTRVAASLAPGTKIYVKGRGHAEYLGPGQSDGGTLEFANGITQTVRLDKAEWTPMKEPVQSRTGRPVGHPNAALGWTGLDSLDEFEAKHSPRTAAGPYPVVRGPFDVIPGPTRRMSREQPSQHNPLVLVPGAQLDDPYRQGQVKIRTPRGALSQLGPEPEPEPEAFVDEYMTVLPGGVTLAEANRLKEEANARERAREARRHREVLELVRDKVDAKSTRLTNVFRQFDENHDGVVSYGEFRRGLHSLGVELNDTDFETLVETVDIDGQGTVDYNEFACVLASHALCTVLRSRLS